MLLVQKSIHRLQIRWISKGTKRFSAWVGWEGWRANANLPPCLEAPGLCSSHSEAISPSPSEIDGQVLEFPSLCLNVWHLEDIITSFSPGYVWLLLFYLAMFPRVCTLGKITGKWWWLAVKKKKKWNSYSRSFTHRGFRTICVVKDGTSSLNISLLY